MPDNEKDGSKISIDFSGFDPIGIKGATDISKEVVKFGLEGAKEFLNLTCKPLLEEFGLGLRDKFTNWKLMNIIKMLEKANGKLVYDPEKEKLVIDPRVAYQIIENASNISDDNLQEMWAGLFAASCEHYEEDENIFFTEILKRLTSAQVKFLNAICLACVKRIDISRLPDAQSDGEINIIAIEMAYADILKIMQTESRLKADSEFSQLEKMGLIQINFTSGGQGHMDLMQIVKSNKTFRIKPLTPALRLFVKCQGSRLSPFDYFLDELLDYYHQLLAEDEPLPKTELLNFFIKEATRQEEIGISSGGTTEGLAYMIKIKGEKLSAETITSMLKSYIIKYRIASIAESAMVKVNDLPYGMFRYKDGFTSFYKGSKL